MAPALEDRLPEVACSSSSSRGSTNIAATESLDSIASECMTSDSFVQLQAILTVMPQHALATESGGFMECGLCTSRGVSDPNSSVGPVDRALMEAMKDYPEFADDLGNLSIVHASADLVCFVDHLGCRIFTAIRGTDFLTPRDLGNDALIALGFSTVRAEHVRDEYRTVRERYPSYKSYGCGHSLGGVVMHELAYSLGDQREYAFTRVDVFNAGGSPFGRSQTPLADTEFLSHRVVGDLVSYFYQPLGRTVLYEPDPEHSVHLMGHFLPRKEPPTLERLLRQLLEAPGAANGAATHVAAAMGYYTWNPSSPDYSVWPLLNVAFGLSLPF